MDLPAGRIRTADVIKRAIGGNLRSQKIAARLFQYRLHGAGFNLQLLDAERSQACKMAMAVPAYAGGLKHQTPSFTGYPAWRSVARIALRRLAEAGLLIDSDGDFLCADPLPHPPL